MGKTNYVFSSINKMQNIKTQKGQFTIEHGVFLGSLASILAVVGATLGNYTQALYSWLQLLDAVK